MPKLDTGTAAAASGQRSAVAPSSARQLVFGTEAADIAVSVSERPGGGMLDVIGQVFPDSESEEISFKAVLLKGRDEAAISGTDDFGEFAFEAVTPGEYYMLISNEAQDVTIVPLQLGV
jgi:hypothetical protein